MIIAVWSLIAFTWMILYAIYELVLVAKWLSNGNYIYWSQKHSIEHLVYLLSYVLWNTLLLYWFLTHQSLNVTLNLHFIGEQQTYTFISLAVSWLFLIKHIQNERNNEVINH